MAVETQTLARPDAHLELVQRLDGQVRERVRREGVDPQREALVVRRIAEDVVRDHDQLSLTGAVAPIADSSMTPRSGRSGSMTRISPRSLPPAPAPGR